MPHKCLLIPISNALPLSTAQGEGQVVEAQIPLSVRSTHPTPNPRFHRGRCAGSGAGGGMGAWFAGLLNGITKASVNGRREGQIGNSGARCVRCRREMAGGGRNGEGDICDGQAVVNVQLGHNASNGQVATMDSWQMQTLT